MKEIMVELKRMREWLDWMKPMPPMSAWNGPGGLGVNRIQANRRLMASSQGAGWCGACVLG